jgi:hypothetical protein
MGSLYSTDSNIITKKDKYEVLRPSNALNLFSILKPEDSSHPTLDI